MNVKTETPSLENQNGAIPVGLNLAGRGLSGDIRCKHCGQHETDLHFFLECPFANRVWNLIPALHMPSSINVNSTTQLIPDADLSPWVLWYLWTARNKLCFENVLLSEQEVATLAIKEARPWQNAQQCKAPFSLPITTSKSNQPITLPTEPQCFVDAAWSLATQLGGFGWVINDPISGVSRSMSSNRSHTRDHLLLSCQFAEQIWDQVFNRLGTPSTPFFQWSDLIGWLMEAQLKAQRLLRLLASQAVVYCIWKQRNNLLHNNITMVPLAVFKEINRLIINTIHARKRRRRFQNIMQHWLI